MKELSIEEKAKAYDKLLVKLQEAKVDNEVCDERYCCVINDIVPELAESEDEKIRKSLIDMLKNDEKCYLKEIAWLEKQGDIDKTSYEIAEKEKCEFVGDGFIKCYASFQDFKEGETYWLEYIGNDKYNVRSDNLLGKTYHITPCQLYTVFKKLTWLENQGEPTEINPSEFDLHLNKLLMRFEPLPKEELTSILSFYLNVVQNNGTYKEEKQGEQKPAEWNEEDKIHYNKCLQYLESISPRKEDIEWFKSLKNRFTWKPSDKQIYSLDRVLSFYGKGTVTYDFVKELLEQLKKL